MNHHAIEQTQSYGDNVTRWLGTSAPSSRGSYGDSIASMGVGCLKFDFHAGAGQVGPVRDALVRSLEAGKRARDVKTPEVSALRASPRDGGARTAAFSAALNLSEKAGLLLAEDVAQRQLTPERRAALGQERARQQRARVS